MSAIPTDQIDRRLIHSTATVTFAPLDDDGAAVTIAASPAPSALLKDGSGTVVNAALATTLAGGAKSLSAVVPAADLDTLDTYSIEWSATVGSAALTWATALEVAGGFYFNLGVLRGLRPEFATATATQLHEARRLAEDTMEAGCEIAFVPRGARLTLRGTGRDAIVLPWAELREVYSASIDGTALTVEELAALEPDHEAGILRRPSGSVWTADETVLLHIAHGYDRPPWRVRDAAMTLAREFVTPDSAIPNRATAQSIGDSVYRLTIAGRDGFTGIPDVDAVIDANARPRPVIG